MCSCETIAALYGVCNIPKIVVSIVAWNTQLAAPIRASGIFNCVFTNQTPTVSAAIKTMTAIMACMYTAMLKTLLNCPSVPFPNS